MEQRRSEGFGVTASPGGKARGGKRAKIVKKNIQANSDYISSCLRRTRNSLVDEIGERYRLNHANVVKLHYPYTQFPRNVRLYHPQIATFSAHCDCLYCCALQILLLTYWGVSCWQYLWQFYK